MRHRYVRLDLAPNVRKKARKQGSPKPKLTDAQVNEIRAYQFPNNKNRHEVIKEIAKKYGVTDQYVYVILSGYARHKADLVK